MVYLSNREVFSIRTIKSTARASIASPILILTMYFFFTVYSTYVQPVRHHYIHELSRLRIINQTIHRYEFRWQKYLLFDLATTIKRIKDLIKKATMKILATFLPINLAVDMGVTGQTIPLDEDCPLIPDCCEDDCCGVGTVFSGLECQPGPSSSGWDHTYPWYHDFGCSPRICCEYACCAEGTIWDVATSYCVIADTVSTSSAPTAQNDPTTGPTSNDQDCFVVIVTPSCICHEDDPTTLHDFEAVAIDPPGGTFSWKLTKKGTTENSDKAEIVDPPGSGGALIKVKTLKHSDQADDVTLTVIYTVTENSAVKTCTASVDFTVLDVKNEVQRWHWWRWWRRLTHERR